MKGRCIEFPRLTAIAVLWPPYRRVPGSTQSLPATGTIANPAAATASSLASWRNSLAQKQVASRRMLQGNISVHCVGAGCLYEAATYVVSGSTFAPPETRANGGRRQRFYGRHNPARDFNGDRRVPESQGREDRTERGQLRCLLAAAKLEFFTTAACGSLRTASAGHSSSMKILLAQAKGRCSSRIGWWPRIRPVLAVALRTKAGKTSASAACRTVRTA